MALDHAAACGDMALTGRLLWSLAPRYASEGRSDVICEWLERLGPQPRAEFALAAAVAHLAAGRGAPAERATDSAQRALARTPVNGGEAAIALLRACIGRDGLGALAADAGRAGALLPPESPWQALVGLLLGVERHLADDHESARALLEDAVTRAAPTDRLVLAVANAQLALLAAEDGDWEEADRRSACAYAALVGDLPPAPRALVLATATLVAAERGEISRARHDAADASRILAAQPDAPPWLLAEAQLWLARAEIKLSDGPAARALLARSARLLPRAAGESALTRWLHDGWGRADAFAESATGDGPMLTNAELRVLRLLPSHMTFREIGARLHVSTNTVKTQALAVYRKLDVSCRSDAVSRGRAAGLIDGA
jgi:LuxR family maltose regulon positive regulatory protein